MQFLKILAIAYATGGNTEVEQYLQSIDDLMSKPSGNVEKMKTMAEELKNSLDVADIPCQCHFCKRGSTTC